MKIFFRTLAIVMAALFAVYMVGCGGDEEPDTPDAEFDSASPADGGTVAANGQIVVKFTENPGEVTASAGNVSGSGKSRTIKGPFEVGSLALTVEWENGGGSTTLNYTVEAADETPPAVASSSPANGDKNLDPAKVFEDGIEVVFTEPLDATSKLMLMDGDDDVGWTSTVDGDTVTLTGNAGQELSNETEYTISGTVKDGAGNEAEVKITFTTKAKE